MSIAIFKPLDLAAGEGEKVWGKLVQRVIDESELEAYKSEGWFTDANEALTAADTAAVEAENVALQSQIDEATKKLDGRTKAAREAKAAEQSAP
jgi:hypothetical protein